MGTKVMKYPLIYVEGCGDYRNLNQELWTVQRTTREIENRSIMIYYDWDRKSYDNWRATGNYLNAKAELGCSIQTYAYRKMRYEYPQFSSSNLTATQNEVWKKYKKIRDSVYKGEASLPTYKADQPIILDAGDGCCKIIEDGPDTLLICTVFSKDYSRQKQYEKIVFKIRVQDNTQKTILSHVLDGTYTMCDSKLIFEKRGWYLSLTYKPKEKTDEPNNSVTKDKILGVDLGVVNALYASSLGEHERLRIPGDEIITKYRQIEARTYAMQKQARHCGEGRIGHGTKTRVSAVFDARERLSAFRDTINHRYSKKLVDFAVKNGYNVIQMENLSGIKNATPENGHEVNRVLRHWTYYDLQKKIEYKAKGVGIKFLVVNPHYTSQRCSRCGYISAENRRSQSEFVCQNPKCGFKANADYNASQNLSIPNIDKIIQEWQKANGANKEQTEKNK